jgi:hypothetical protein
MLVKLARCLRTHGINIPDPDASGGLKFPEGMTPESPRFQAAQAACSKAAGPKAGS